MVATLTRMPRIVRSEGARRLSQATMPLCSLLRQLAAVVAKLNDAQYTQKPVGVVPSSVGGHVRHCLEHVRTLLNAVESGGLDYDSRQRGTPVENSRCSAISEIDELVSHLQHLSGDVIDRTLSMSVILASDSEPIPVHTTVGRELAFVLSHTVHHNALVGAMVKTLGGWLPDRFGYAPATLKHMDQSCVR